MVNLIRHTNSKIQIILQPQMDLPYPSRPNLDHNENIISRLDKRMRSTIWSVKDLSKNDQDLTAGLRKRLVKFIERDRVAQLAKKLEDNSVNLQTEIGSKGSRWSLMHYCARWNSVACLEYILRLQYKTSEEDYPFIIHAKTIQGDTPLMIAILYDSRKVIQLLLDYGGSDIFLINNNKLTAYQLAVSNKNELAIKLLIDYEHANKHEAYINTVRLAQPYTLPEQEVQCCCVGMFQSFINWAFREPKDKDLFQKNRDSTSTSRPSGTDRRQILDNIFLDMEFPRTVSSICEDVQLLKNYNIEWYRAEQLFMLKDIKLFENSNPFDIKQLNFTLKHQLTIIQCIARLPWIVRRIFKEAEQKGAYSLQLFTKGYTDKVVVDDFIPCLNDKKQPVFLMDERELWPMLLQKALVKSYGCYVNSRNIEPIVLLQQLTGYPTMTFQLSQHKVGLFQTLQSLTKCGYIVVLVSKKDSKLQEEGQGSDSFCVLNFYEKDGKQLYLVNCPFLLPDWKQKDKSEALGLRLIKAHYNNHNQMSLWFDDDKIHEIFETFTVCYANQESVRSQVKALSKGFFFFKFQIKEDSQLEFILNLYDHSDNKLKQLSISSLSISCNETFSNQFFRKHSESFDKLTCLRFTEGEYFCKIELPNPATVKNIVLVMHGPNKIVSEYVDEEIGKIEWLYLLKEKLLDENKFKDVGNGLKVCWEKLSDYYVVVLNGKQYPKDKCKYYMQLNQPGVSLVVQGFKESPTKIRFQAIDERQSYAIFKLSLSSSLEQLDVRYMCN